MSEEHPGHHHKAVSKRDQEEDYFRKQDLELIRKLRAKQDAERRELERRERMEAHWMRCPKCGAEMKEIEFLHVRLDECTECKGIFADHGELEILMKAKEQGKFLERLLRKLG